MRGIEFAPQNLRPIGDRAARGGFVVNNRTSYTGAVAATGEPDAGDTHQIEIWTYNFGPNMFMERIEIRDGIVVDIQSLGYGFNEPPGARFQ